jgi:tRNA threonylcarbamoyladenosine biosynthesis protein TsaB
MSQETKEPILLINTALQEASVGIAVDGQLMDQLINPIQKEHAAFLHPAIATLCKNNQIELDQFKAVSVINGPGSYTGLRVGLSAAKGICYAKQIPLICINTLEWMAYGNKELATALIVPMIDARRMEVFTAVYTNKMESILAPTNIILEESSYVSYLDTHQALFIGDGAAKWKSICQHSNASFADGIQSEHHHATLATSRLHTKHFANLFTASPFYTKEFYSTQKA